MDNKKAEAEVQVLKNLRKDIMEMEWEKLADDGRTILVSKPAVLALVQDWIELSLNPSVTEATQ